MKDRTALAWLVAIPVLVVLGLIVATIVVSISWGVMIHEEAFFCSDDLGAVLGFFEGTDSHRQAGDELGEGWTWERIEQIRGYHVAAFWVVTMAPFILICFDVVRSRFGEKKVS